MADRDSLIAQGLWNHYEDKPLMTDRTPRLTPKAERELDARWKLEKEAARILGLVVAEWNTDPLSVQCFDLRIVERAKQVVSRLDNLITDWEKP